MAKKKNINANGYEYVDLGLPSGTLWATANIGADKPSDVGLYFAWGNKKGYTAEQIEKDELTFNWYDYKFSINGSNTTFNKYADCGGKLQLRDDAAHINMGGDWRIPTPEQIQELIDNTTSKWTKLNGVKGRLFISKVDDTKSIFIPATGYAYNGAVQVAKYFGGIWSSMIDAKKIDCAKDLGIEYDDVFLSHSSRCLGLSIRSVIG